MSFDKNMYAGGTGIGQIIDINEKQTKAVFKVDADTYYQIEKCFEERKWDWAAMRKERSSFYSTTYIISVSMGFNMTLRFPTVCTYGRFFLFHWSLNPEKEKIVIDDVENPQESRWSSHVSYLEDSDEE